MLDRMRNRTIANIASGLTKVLTTEQMAGLLSSLVGIDAREDMHDAELLVLIPLFDELCKYNPDAVDKAAGQ